MEAKRELIDFDVLIYAQVTVFHVLKLSVNRLQAGFSLNRLLYVKGSLWLIKLNNRVFLTATSKHRELYFFPSRSLYSCIYSRQKD